MARTGSLVTRPEQKPPLTNPTASAAASGRATRRNPTGSATQSSASAASIRPHLVAAGGQHDDHAARPHRAQPATNVHSCISAEAEVEQRQSEEPTLRFPQGSSRPQRCRMTSCRWTPRQPSRCDANHIRLERSAMVHPVTNRRARFCRLLTIDRSSANTPTGNFWGCGHRPPWSPPTSTAGVRTPNPIEPGRSPSQNCASSLRAGPRALDTSSEIAP